MISTITTSLVPSTPSKLIASQRDTLSTLSKTLTQPRAASSTPKSTATPPQPTLPPPSPGTWRHPKFTEIAARQAASTFSDRNLKTSIANAVALAVSVVFGDSLHDLLLHLLAISKVPNAGDVTSYTLLVLRLCLLFNVMYALRPIIPYIQPKDEITDIPLTPSQRALLGLSPSNASTPTSAASASYITPPRYRRSSGSFSPSPSNTGAASDRRSISANYGSSPLSSSGISATQPHFRNTARKPNDAPLSNSAMVSPLLQRAVLREQSSPRQSFGASTSTSGLSRSQSVRERGSRGGRGMDPGTPSPVGSGVKRSPGLNYKWLYEKGKKLPKSDSMQF